MNQDWSTWLLHSTQAMAQATQNPVLAVLPADRVLVAQQKYPPERLGFGGDRWRAFYHYHQAPGRPAGEHGHFHLFVRDAEDADWGHLAALSMDELGQPMRWFVVNRWVTDGPWLSAERLIYQLNHLPDPASLTTLEQWLLAMLGLYRDELAQLLYDRDRQLSHINAKHEDKHILEKRNVYELASSPIDLLARLEQVCEA